jgi:hypothetical protein
MAVRNIQAHLQEIYGMEPPELVSRPKLKCPIATRTSISNAFESG